MQTLKINFIWLIMVEVWKYFPFGLIAQNNTINIEKFIINFISNFLENLKHWYSSNSIWS